MSNVLSKNLRQDKVSNMRQKPAQKKLTCFIKVATANSLMATQDLVVECNQEEDMVEALPTESNAKAAHCKENSGPSPQLWKFVPPQYILGYVTFRLCTGKNLIALLEELNSILIIQIVKALCSPTWKALGAREAV